MSVYTTFARASLYQNLIYLIASRLLSIAAGVCTRWQTVGEAQQRVALEEALTGMRHEMV